MNLINTASLCAFALLLMSYTFVYAQDKPEKLLELNKAAAREIYKNPELAISLSTTIFEKARLTKNSFAMGYAKFVAAEAHNKLGKKNTAYFHGTEAIALLEQADTLDSYSLYRLHRNQAMHLSDFGYHTEAAQHIEWAKPYIKLFRKTHPEMSKKYKLDLVDQQLTYYQATYLRDSGEPSKGDSLLLSLLYSDLEIDQPNYYARTKNQLGLSYYRYNDYVTAELQFKDALKIDVISETFRAHIHHNLANAYSKQKDFVAARVEMNKSIEINTKLERSRYLFVNLKDLAEIAKDQQLYDEAITISIKAEGVFPDFEKYFEYADLYRTRELAYYGKRDYASAEKAGLKFTALFDKIVDLLPKIEFEESLYKVTSADAQASVEVALKAEAEKSLVRLIFSVLAVLLASTSIVGFVIWYNKQKEKRIQKLV
jgi:tetratricopeptide (TPR) repeat protein